MVALSLDVCSIVLFACLVLAVSGGKCPSLIDCRDLGSITFPFTDTRHPDCGILVIHGCDDHEPGAKKSIKSNNTWFDIVDLEGFTITIRDDILHDLLLQKSCDTFSHESRFTISSPLAKASLKHYVAILRCNDALDAPPNHYVSNSTLCKNETLYSMVDADPSSYSDVKGCSMVQLPTTSFDPVNELDPSGISDDLFKLITDAFTIQIEVSPDCSTCLYVHQGQCRLDNAGKFYCDQGKSIKTRLIVAAIASAAGALGVVIFLAWCIRRRFYSKKNVEFGSSEN